MVLAKSVATTATSLWGRFLSVRHVLVLPTSLWPLSPRCFIDFSDVPIAVWCSRCKANYPLPCKLLTSRRLRGRAYKPPKIAAPEVVLPAAHSESCRALYQKLGLACEISNATGVTPAISLAGLLYTSEKQLIRSSTFLSKGGFSLEVVLL